MCVGLRVCCGWVCVFVRVCVCVCTCVVRACVFVCLRVYVCVGGGENVRRSVCAREYVFVFVCVREFADILFM